MQLNNPKVSMAKPTLNQTSSSKTNIRSVGSLNNYGGSSRPASLAEGQIIKGEVSDLRNNEVSVLLENNIKVTGFIQNAEHLSIGQPAAFKVLSISPSQIILEAMPNSYTSSEQITIRKALEEANLPQSDKNKSIVHELLHNQLSINKQSIQNILQQSFHYKDISISTLVLMNKYHIPITPENTLQFEHYRNQEHQFIKEIESITQALPSLLEQLAADNPATSLSAFGNRLLTLLLNGLYHHPESQTSSILMLDSIEECTEVIETLSKFHLEDTLKEQLLNNSAPLRDIAKAIKESMNLSEEMDMKNMEEALLSLEDNLDTEKNPELLSLEAFQIPKSVDSLNTPVIRGILEKFQDFQMERRELASFLSPEEQEHFLEQLKEFPINSHIKEKILFGEATAKEVLTILKNVINLTNPEAVKNLFQSHEFQATFRESLRSNWTLTPHSLAKKDIVPQFYNNLYQQINDLHTLLQTSLSGENAANVLNQTEHMKQNMNFMHTLNDMFPYVQLPIQLKNKNIHSELYVYTKKRAIQKDPDNICVLLHLDMDYLGSLDIHLTLHSNQVTAKFYFQEEDAKELIANNMLPLERALNEKGFLLQAELLDRTQSVDIVEDFIAADMKNASMKRFTFDIRA